MKTISQIYSKYKIMPNLQQHQLRVAAVAKQICESIEQKLNIEGVIQACLLHDMGNIIKFNLPYFPQFLEPEGLVYWTKVKEQFIAKYGSEEHKATIMIALELNVSKIVISNINSVCFSNIIKNANNALIEEKICCYSDMRVGPLGVLSIENRIKEGGKRYSNHPTHRHLIASKDLSSSILPDLLLLEKQIFQHANIKPSDINDESISQDLKALKNYILP